jgi:hypothetical protein
MSVPKLRAEAYVVVAPEVASELVVSEISADDTTLGDVSAPSALESPNAGVSVAT